MEKEFKKHLLTELAYQYSAAEITGDHPLAKVDKNTLASAFQNNTLADLMEQSDAAAYMAEYQKFIATNYDHKNWVGCKIIKADGTAFWTPNSTTHPILQNPFIGNAEDFAEFDGVGHFMLTNGSWIKCSETLLARDSDCRLVFETMLDGLSPHIRAMAETHLRNIAGQMYNEGWNDRGVDGQYEEPEE